jgi:asparagine N-glycosylation enzyme membrane subunit Stt3
LGLVISALITISWYSRSKSKKYDRENREVILRLSQMFSVEMYHDEAMESKMRHDFWPADHPAALLALVATAILAFAWPSENVPACVLAAVMIVVATGIAIRAHFRSASMS